MTSTFFSSMKSKVSGFMAKHGTKAYAIGLTIGTTATALTTSAFADETHGGDGSSFAASVTSLVDVEGITSLLSSVFSFMTSNPLLSFYIGVGVISAVCYIFRRLRKTSH